MKTLDHALLLKRHNLRVTPVYEPVGDDCSCPPTSGTRKDSPGGRCKSPGKHPVGEQWQTEASNDPRKLHDWFKDTNRNIGIVCDATLATLDIDPRNGGLESIAKLIAESGPLPDSWHADTGGNGEHRPFRHPGGDLRASFGRDYPGVDVLRGHKQFLVEPSAHVSGNRYTWRTGFAPWDRPLAELPPAWIERLRRKPPVSAPRTVPVGDDAQRIKRASAYLGKMPEAIQGNRGNDDLWAAVCRMMHGFDLSDSDVKRLIVDEYNHRCAPPWSEREIDRVIDDAHDAEAHKWRVEDKPRDELGDRRRRKQTSTDGASVANDNQHPGLGPEGGYRLTDLGNARRFADMHAARWRYVPVWKQWVHYTGTHWSREQTGGESRAARNVVAKIYADAAACAQRAAVAVNAGDPTFAGSPAEEMVKWARTSSKRGSIDNMLAVARSESEIAASPDTFDFDPFLFNVLNGTIDLRTGKLREHRCEDMLTRIAPVEYDPNATGDEFLRFVGEVLPDEEVRAWIQRFLGYCLTGSVREQKFAFFVGKGGNGKNVLVDAVKSAMGPYALTGAPDLLLEKRNDAHPTELADIEGSRLVICSEIEAGRSWAEARIKQITGDQTLKARGMKENFRDWDATSKLVVLANTRPKVRSQDDGLWRRMRLVPWTVQIPEDKQDRALLGRLQANELPGILAWLVAGCLDWYRSGLGTAKAIEVATSEYRTDQDVLGLWIADCAKLGAGRWCATTGLYESYLAWCNSEQIEHPWARRTFAMRLTERVGIKDERRHEGRGLSGIALLGPGEVCDA